MELTVYNDYGSGWTQVDPFYYSRVLKHRESLNKIVQQQQHQRSNEAHVLVLFTGGTIGMMRGPSGGDVY